MLYYYHRFLYVVDLTLTSVVFESSLYIFYYFLRKYLTLTSVVFESSYFPVVVLPGINLTLTSVVFEFSPFASVTAGNKHLTLTSVVFELVHLQWFPIHLIRFNFNKCCI